MNMNIFGSLPKRPLHLSVGVSYVNEQFMDGRLTLKEYNMDAEFEGGHYIIPLKLLLPKGKAPCPAVIVLCNEDTDGVEEWINKGYAIITLNACDITDNNGNFKSGLSGFIAPTRRKKSSAGKICVWAWALIRALECAEVLDDIDRSEIGLFGKGIFGLSAMLAGSEGERFAFIEIRDLPEITESFVLLNPHLFSPECVKNANFDNIS